MEQKKVIDSKNIPTRFPVVGTYVIVQGLHYWNAPQLVWGIIITILVLFWIALIITFFKEDKVDILKDK